MWKSKKQLIAWIDGVFENYLQGAADDYDGALHSKLCSIQESLHKQILGSCCERDAEKNELMLELSNELQSISEKTAQMSSRIDKAL